MGSIPPAMVGEEGWGGGGEVRCEMSIGWGLSSQLGFSRAVLRRGTSFEQ